MHAGRFFRRVNRDGPIEATSMVEYAALLIDRFPSRDRDGP